MEENVLIVDKSMREKMVKRTEILDKVKKLLMVDGLNMSTTSQVADFYEVKEVVITSLMHDNKQELLSDGMKKYTSAETRSLLVSSSKEITTYKGYYIADGIRFAYAGTVLFPKRAVLRVGMLLRDSDVAREVRTQLLNTEENSDIDTKTKNINEEQSLMIAVGMAISSGDVTALAVATTKLMEFKNRHIANVEAKCEELKETNESLATGILEWEDRSKLNFAVRKLAALTKTHYPYLWNELYSNLKYKYHIDLKARVNKNFISAIREDEWETVIRVFSAMCVKDGYTSSYIFKNI